jgi:hypothetical protein
MLDDSTRRIIIQKTWCHGQLLAPIFGLLCWYWYFTVARPSVLLIYAGIVLPSWCYVSYRNVFIQFATQQLVIGGVLVEIAYIAIFFLAVPNVHKNGGSSSSFYLLICIASILFAIETLAFLLVSFTLQKRNNTIDYRRDYDSMTTIPLGTSASYTQREQSSTPSFEVPGSLV